MIARTTQRCKRHHLAGAHWSSRPLSPAPGPKPALLGPLPYFLVFPGPIQDMVQLDVPPLCPACIHACPAVRQEKLEGQPSKRPRAAHLGGGGGAVETCEARGLGGGLRARFLYWDTILCMSTKRPTTKKQRSSPNPSSASNAEVGLEELVERDFFWKLARARIFCWESTGGMDINRSTIKYRVANPNSGRAGSTKRGALGRCSPISSDAWWLRHMNLRVNVD